MAHMTMDGKRKANKFQAHRADREHAKDKEKEPKMGGKMTEEPKEPEDTPQEEPGSPAEEAGEEMIHPDIHQEIKQISAEHGPAHTVNMTHDHEGMTSHVHSVHADGHEHHGEHEGEGHVMNAHHHGMHAAGLNPPEEPTVPEQPEGMGEGGDNYEVPPLE